MRLYSPESLMINAFRLPPRVYVPHIPFWYGTSWLYVWLMFSIFRTCTHPWPGTTASRQSPVPALVQPGLVNDHNVQALSKGVGCSYTLSIPGHPVACHPSLAVKCGRASQSSMSAAEHPQSGGGARRHGKTGVKNGLRCAVRFCVPEPLRRRGPGSALADAAEAEVGGQCDGVGGTAGGKVRA